MNNPVGWQLWDAEAIDLAKRHNRLIFLSIGYSACHCKFSIRGALCWHNVLTSIQGVT